MNQYIDHAENSSPSRGGETSINRTDVYSVLETGRYSVQLNDGRSIDVQAETCEVDKGSGTLTFRTEGKIQYVFSPHYFIFCKRA
jgi:hypothetical protein